MLGFQDTSAAWIAGARGRVTRGWKALHLGGTPATWSRVVTASDRGSAGKKILPVVNLGLAPKSAGAQRG